MWVTSDCHDPAVWARILDDRHEEVLIGGVGFYGSGSADPLVGGRFLLRAAEIAQVPLSIAGYSLEGERRTRNVSPTNLLRVLGGAQRRSLRIKGLLVSNDEPGPFVGGEVNTRTSLSGAVVFPEQGCAIGRLLLAHAATELGAEYGYYFVRDGAFLPRGYALGVIGGIVTVGVEDETELEDLAAWGELAVRGNYWSRDKLLLRDVYEINLLCERHLALQLGGGTLGEWIANNPGRLDEIAHGRYIWSIDERDLKGVRMELSMAGALLSRHKPKYR